MPGIGIGIRLPLGPLDGSGGNAPTTSELLLETGDNLLLENGDNLQLE